MKIPGSGSSCSKSQREEKCFWGVAVIIFYTNSMNTLIR